MDGESPESIVLADPHGRLETIDASEAQKAISEGGYSVPPPEQIEAANKKAEFGTVPQQLLTGVEGAASAASFGLIPGGKHALERREINPGSRMAGEALGLVGSAALIPGGGAAGVLGRAGEAAAEFTGLAGAKTAIGKIGSAAVKSAAENALFQSGDEVSRMLSQDPNQSLETAVTNIGLSTLIGGGLGGGVGAVNPLWKATAGPRVGMLLKAVSDRANGLEATLPPLMEDALHTSGLEISPEIRAGLSDNLDLQNAFKTLQQSDTTASGQAFQKAYQDFRVKAGDSLVESLGRAPKDVEGLEELSAYDAGKKVQAALADELKAQIKPVSELFNEVQTKFAGTNLPGAIKNDLASQIGELAEQEGYTLSPSSLQAKEINRVINELPNLKTLDDLRKYTSVMNQNTAQPELYRLGGGLRKLFRAAEENVVTDVMGKEAPEMLTTHSQARVIYKDLMEKIDDLNSRLHVGKYYGPDSFVSALKEMSPEDILRRTSGRGDVDFLKLIGETFPSAAKEIKNYHIDSVLKQSAQKVGPGETINPRKLFSLLDKMSPELKEFAFPEASQFSLTNKVDGIKKILDHFDQMPHNFSNTARTVDKLLNQMPGSAMAILAMLTGHNPAMALVMEPLAKMLGRDAPDAVRLGLLKFMGSGQPIESEGFKSMVDFIHHTMRGENLLSKATKAIFKTGQEVLPQGVLPTEKRKEKLDKALKELQLKQDSLFEMGGKTAHYLPDHGVSMGQYAANAVNVVNGLRPNTQKQGMLDSEVKLSKAEEAKFDRVLTIAEQPLSIFEHIKNGTLTSEDLSLFRTLNPALYERSVQKLSSEMIEHVHKGETIPYRIRMSLSLFLGQPLDSTMTPGAIQLAQASRTIAQPEQMQQPKHSLNHLNKAIMQEQTPGQARESHRLK